MKWHITSFLKEGFNGPTESCTEANETDLAGAVESSPSTYDEERQDKT
jgi:hypothetical protein